MTRILIGEGKLQRVLEGDSQIIHAEAPGADPVDVLRMLSPSWHGRPGMVVQSKPNPSGHGAYMPADFRVGPRRFEIEATIRRDSSIGIAGERDRINALGRNFPVVVHDAHGVREVRGFMFQAPEFVPQRHPSRQRYKLWVEAPDPIKYGPLALFTAGLAVNEGGEPVRAWRLCTTGATGFVQVSLGGHVTRWEGTASGGVIVDMRQGTARTVAGTDVTTGVVRYAPVYLPPGDTPMTITTDAASAWLEVRPGWM